MCDHTHNAIPDGSSLEHGVLHEADHVRRSRRSFLRQLGLTVAGAPFMLGNAPMRAYAAAPVLSMIPPASEDDRVLVLLQLKGGNDGLNTVVPYTTQDYYDQRPDIAIPDTSVITLDDMWGLHPAMQDLTTMWAEGQMAIVHAVGYAEQDLSHFVSTRYWVTASDPAKDYSTGWMGRYLDNVYPDYLNSPPSEPVAVQMGYATSKVFLGPQAEMAMSLRDPEEFYRIAQTGARYDVDDVPSGPSGEELAYARSVANAADLYSSTIKTASDSGNNQVTYPDSELAEHLSIVARLVKGGLGCRIYMVSIGGFDTHEKQVGRHADLWEEIAGAVKTFFEDLGVGGHQDRVAVMSFSEFGRRWYQNGSLGTDHGAAAPLFLFGPGVAGGFHGTIPDFNNLEGPGNLTTTTDYRTIYSAVLQEWLGVAPAQIELAIGGSYPGMETLFQSAPLSLPPRPIQPQGEAVEDIIRFQLRSNYPNPFRGATLIEYALPVQTHVRLEVYDIQGHRVEVLVNEEQASGWYQVPFSRPDLPSGTYLYRIQTPHQTLQRTMTLVR